MLKVLIICKNLSIVKTITNKVICDLKELQIVGIANEFNEAKEIITEREPDLIITTLSGILEFLENNINFYTPKVIIISKSEETYTDHKSMLVLNFNLNFKTMSKYILKFIQEDISDSKKDLAMSILLNLGFNFKLMGTTYLLDSILYATTYKGYYTFDKLKRDIYSYVAIINKTDSDKVKWSIDRSIKYMYSKHSKDSYNVVEKYFGIKYPKKPTPKLIISVIANYLI